jgi:hypothetical protein
MIDPGAVIGDQLHLSPAWPSIAPSIVSVIVGTSTSARFIASDQLVARQRRVLVAQFDVEKLLQAGFDRIGQASRDDNTQTLEWHQEPPGGFPVRARAGRLTHDETRHKNPRAVAQQNFAAGRKGLEDGQ